MSQHEALPNRIKSGADLVFPKYQPKKTRWERFLRLRNQHHKALAQVETIVAQSAAHGYDRIMSRTSRTTSPSTDLAIAKLHEECAHTEYADLMPVLESLETETLRFIAESYKGTVTSRYSDLITTALHMNHLQDVLDSGEDINLIVKNVISYRLRVVSWERKHIRAFNDVRLSAPELNRPDLYNLTGEQREWATLIMHVSEYSQACTQHLDKGDMSPHMNPGLAALIREDHEWASCIGQIIVQRGMKASEITPDLVRDMHTTGSMLLNEGML